jgi:hypothetical protein
VDASLVRSSPTTFDFNKLEIENGEFLFFPLSERSIENLTLKNCCFGELAFPTKNWVATAIEDSLAQRVTGVSSAAAFPSWIRNIQAEEFDSVESISRIRKIGLKPAQEILITVIRKTFFQKGSGRKEEALLRGLGTLAAKSMSTKILNIMIQENLLTTFRGGEGTVYAPVRSNTNRMQRILDELGGSQDPLWQEVSNL